MIVVLCCRFRTVHTTERTPGVTSVLRLSLTRHATGEKIDDCRLWLPIAVKPVIGNHASRKNDGHPEHKREASGNSGGFWRYPVQFPSGDPAINARVEDPDVQASQQQHDHFGSEENILVGTEWYGGKKERSTDDHD